MQLVTLDFETYFDADYSLKKLTTEEYVRDPRFKVHCTGYKLGDKESCTWYGNGFIKEKVEGYGVLAHHAHFDGLILSHHYGVKPAFWFDTLSMARLLYPHDKSHSLEVLAGKFGLGTKTVPYELFKGVRDLPPDVQKQLEDGCAHDVELTYQLFQRMKGEVPKEEFRVIDLTIKMFTDPVLNLDVSMIEEYLHKIREQKEKFLADYNVTREDLHSSAKFAAILERLGKPAPKKISPRTGKETYAFAKTDDAMKELLADENPVISGLAAARLGVKSTIEETRAERFLGMARRGALPVYLKHAGAHTLRWSGGDKVNFQNLKRGSPLRLSLTAPGESSVVVVDSSQIECRVLNWLAGEPWVLDAFVQGRDIYSENGTRYYGRKITKKDKTERHLGKTIELGCGFGMGWEKFQLTCRQGALGGPPIILSDNEAKKAIDMYRDTHPRVVNLWNNANRWLSWLYNGEEQTVYINDVPVLKFKSKRIYLPNGTYLDYSPLYREGREYFMATRKGPAKIYGAKLVENVVQALARVIIAEKMLSISQFYKIVTCTHDEVVYLAPFEAAEMAYQLGLSIMKERPRWAPGLPLDAEGGHDVRYSK